MEYRLTARRNVAVNQSPTLNEIYGEWGGPISFQQAIERKDGSRVSETNRRRLEEAQFDEMRRIAEHTIHEASLM